MIKKLSVFLPFIFLICWQSPTEALNLHKTLLKAGPIHPQAGWVKLYFNQKTKYPILITLDVIDSAAESDGRGRIQFHTISVPISQAKIPTQAELWHKFLFYEDAPDMVFHDVSGQVNELIGSLTWRGVDRHIRTHYQLKGDRVNFRFSGHLIDWAFEEAPPKGLEVDSYFEIEVEVPVRYVRPAEKR